jgi:hypothetical protein
VHDIMSRPAVRRTGTWPIPSNLWLRPASQFHEARSLRQSRHVVKAADMTTAVPKTPNNATIIAMIATKVSVIAHLSLYLEAEPLQMELMGG